MLASVVIPNKNRIEPLLRAVDSIISSANSHLCEIIIVDDCSEVKPNIERLREQDRIIYLEQSMGAAVARNAGIKVANGQVIFLLDSDDYFTNRDFLRDSEFAIKNKSLCYSRVCSQQYSSNYPDNIATNMFFDYIFSRYQFIAQTSSLFFPKYIGALFDESLPRHQDWDFIYYGFLRKGISVIHGPGEIYFDRSDKNSISRTVDITKSIPWYNKILKDEAITSSDKSYVEYNLMSPSKSRYSWPKFITNSCRYVLSKKSKILTTCKISYKRIFR